MNQQLKERIESAFKCTITYMMEYSDNEVEIFTSDRQAVSTYERKHKALQEQGFYLLRYGKQLDFDTREYHDVMWIKLLAEGD